MGFNRCEGETAKSEACSIFFEKMDHADALQSCTENLKQSFFIGKTYFTAPILVFDFLLALALVIMACIACFGDFEEKVHRPLLPTNSGNTKKPVCVSELCTLL